MEKKIDKIKFDNVLPFPHKPIIKENGELNLPKEFADRRIVQLTEIAMEDIEDTIMNICAMAGYNIQNINFTHDIAIVTILLKAALHRTSGIDDDAIKVLDALKQKVFPLADAIEDDDEDVSPETHLTDEDD